MTAAWQACANLSMISESTNNCEGQAPQYIEPTEIVAQDDGWPGYEEPVFDLLKVLRPSMDMFVQNWPE